MRRPFVVLFIFLLVGILVSMFFNLRINTIQFLIYFLLSTVMILVTDKHQLLIIISLMTVFGVFIYTDFVMEKALLSEKDHPFTLQAKALSEVRERRYHHEVEVLVLYVRDLEGKEIINEKAILQLYADEALMPQLPPGSYLELRRGRISVDLTSNEINSYERYLRSRGNKYIIRGSYEDISLLANEAFSPFELVGSTSYKLKAYILDFFDAVLSSENSSLIKSILFGNQGYMTEDLLGYFSRSGTSHIIAVSGLHIGILVLIIEKFFKVVGLGKNKSILMTLLILYLYSYMVGFPVSIIRAGFMYFLYVLAYFTNRRYDAINSLLFIALIAIIYNPFLIFSVSFQMSFAATLSILVLFPIFTSLLKKLPRAISSLLGVTLAAQIGTLPIAAFYFNQVSIVAPLTNMLIVPTLGVVLTLGLLSSFLSLFFLKLATIVSYPLGIVLGYVYYMVKKTSTLKYSSIEAAEVKLTHIYLYYLVLFAGLAMYNYREHVILYIRKLGKYEL